MGYQNLVKLYLKTAFRVKDIPSLDELHSKVCSRSTWRRNMLDLIFMSMLNNECNKRLNKKLTEINRKLVIKIKYCIYLQYGIVCNSIIDYNDKDLMGEYDVKLKEKLIDRITEFNQPNLTNDNNHNTKATHHNS